MDLVKTNVKHFASQKNQTFCAWIPYTNANSPGLTPIGPPMWQAEADIELTLSASSATAVSQLTLILAN